MPSLKTRGRRRAQSLNRGQTLRRNNRRAKSAERYTNINAEKIGEGGFGIVSRPPARCAHFFSKISKNINNHNINSTVFQEKYYKNPNYISKLSDIDQASKELMVGNYIKRHITEWEDYYCFTEFICKAPKHKHIQTGIEDFQDTYGIAPYCGVTLKSILEEKYYISPKEACQLVDALKELIVGLGNLHELQVYHKDIHNENVLFNSEDKRFRWIDFGLAENLSDEKEKAGDKWETNLSIVSAKMSDTESLIFNIIKPTLQFILHKLDELQLNTELNNSNQECYDKIIQYLDNIPKKARINSNTTKSQLISIKDTYYDFVADFMYDGANA
jgi:serine/threonine protein kinase